MSGTIAGVATLALTLTVLGGSHGGLWTADP